MPHRLKFTCPKCGHTYAIGVTIGPLSSCPNCRYEPTFTEFLDRKPYSLTWIIVIGLFLIALIFAGLAARGILF